jgi:hypothetical protein
MQEPYEVARAPRLRRGGGLDNLRTPLDIALDLLTGVRFGRIISTLKPCQDLTRP